MGQNGSQKKKPFEFIDKNWVLIFILFLTILGTYYESLYHPFINFDDPYYIRTDPYIRDLSWKGLYEIFSRPIVANYFPLQILSYALDYKIWHIHSFGYHLHNVVLHILNAVLVYLLLKKIFSNAWIAFLSALFFGLHPVNVESVTWISERKNVLSVALMLLSFLSYLYYLEEEKLIRRKGLYLATLSLFSLALLAKVSAVVLPLLLILYDFCFLRRGKWEMVKDKILFFVLAIFFSVITVWIYHSGKYLQDYHGGSPYYTFLATINVFVEYIIYLIVPLYQDLYYYTAIPQSIFERQVLLSLAGILLISLLAWQSFGRKRIFLFWFGWFVISLLPVLNIVPIAILRADRYMYLPAIGFFYLISLGLSKIGQIRYRFMGLPAMLLGILLIAGSYDYLTLERNKIWKDFVNLWEDTLKKFPQCERAYRSIGFAYIEREKWDIAITYFQAGLEINPDSVGLLNGLHIAYKHKGDLKKAEESLLQASRIDPKDSGIYNNLAMIYWEKHDTEKALSYLQKALEAEPDAPGTYTNLGAIHYNLNQWDKAIPELEKAIKLEPGFIQPYLSLALIYREQGLLDKAEAWIKKGMDYVPDSQQGFSMLGRISLERGKIRDAKYFLSQAYRLKPNDGDTNYFLGLIAQNEANQYFQKAKEADRKIKAKVVESTADKGPGQKIP